MNNYDFRRTKAKEKENKGRILKVCPEATESAGIYFMKREENGFKYAYIGQAKHLLTRLAGHLVGYQHIDLSLKKHGLFSESNPTGWKIGVMECEERKLDELEKKYILLYANKGYQMRNKTDGGQGEGKNGIADNKPSKTYYDGLHKGYENARKDVANLFKKHLAYSAISDKPNKYQERALEKFKNFINLNGGGESG